MKRKHEIVSGLEHCVVGECMGCPYYSAGGACQACMKKDALELLYKYREMIDELTEQELRTLRGQARAGDKDGALRGLCKLIRRKKVIADGQRAE